MNWYIFRKTKARSEEKKIIKDSIYEQALEKAKQEAIDDVVKSLTFDVRKLKLMKTKAFMLLQNKLQGIDERRIMRDEQGRPMKDENDKYIVNNDLIDVGELQKVIVSVKMELWEFEGMTSHDDEENRLNEEESDTYEKFKSLVNKQANNEWNSGDRKHLAESLQ